MTYPTQHGQFSSLVDRIDTLFDLLEGNRNVNPRLDSPSAHSVTTYDEEYGIQRAHAPLATKCFSCLMGGGGGVYYGGGGGGGGGKATVDILNAVGNMTANIITSAAGAAAVVLPPVTNTLGNIVVNWVNPGGKGTPQTPQQPTVVVYPPKPQPSPQGQWVWSPPGKWVWVPAGQQPPAPQPEKPPQPSPSPSPSPQGEWAWSPPGKWVWVPAGQQPPAPQPEKPPQPSPSPSPSPQGQWVWSPPGKWVWVPAGQQPPQTPAGANGSANASANAYSYPPPSPSQTRSRMPQKMNPALTRSSPRRFSRERSLDSNLDVKKKLQDIRNTLQKMERSIDHILREVSKN